MAVSAALYERLVYAEDGGLVTGSLLDYVLPTASMTPELEIPHQETPSPVTPLGAKGVAEGNSMSAPVCIANAVADALGVAEVNLPLTPERVLEIVRRRTNSRSASVGVPDRHRKPWTALPRGDSGSKEEPQPLLDFRPVPRLP